MRLKFLYMQVRNNFRPPRLLFTVCILAPSSVGNARVTLVDRVINITWSPPSIANGVILQYIVHEMSSSGESYHHIPADQNNLELPYFKDALVFVAAVNQYGQSSFKLAKSSGTRNNYV